MTIVATQTSIETAPPARKSDTEDWKIASLYLDALEKYYSEAVADVIKITNRTSKLKNVSVPSISNEAWHARDQLHLDPYNLKLINNLGALYAKEGQHDQCLNVMMRGWKRAGEIPDVHVRFRFLMKIAELSMGLWKYRQALAVYRDIEEPSEPRELKAYLVLGTQLWCNNGDLQQSLKMFRRCIEDEPYRVALRIFAVLARDLKRVGGYEAAKSTMENLHDHDQGTDLALIDMFVQQSQEKSQVLTHDQLQRRFFVGAGSVFAFFLLCVLFYFERKSFAALAAGKP